MNSFDSLAKGKADRCPGPRRAHPDESSWESRGSAAVANLKSLCALPILRWKMPKDVTDLSKGALEGVIDALLDRQSQLDVRLQELTVGLPGTRLSLQVSGTLTVSVHLRELTDEEKQAHAAATVAHLHA
jgi:hypothetical protein